MSLGSQLTDFTLAASSGSVTSVAVPAGVAPASGAVIVSAALVMGVFSASVTAVTAGSLAKGSKLVEFK